MGCKSFFQMFYNLQFDQTELLYVLLVLFSFYGTILFGWWWAKTRKVSCVYIYVTIMFIATAVTNTAHLWARGYMRYCLLSSETGRLQTYIDNCLETWWWAARLYLWFIAIAGIALHMSYRAFVQRPRLERKWEAIAKAKGIKI